MTELKVLPNQSVNLSIYEWHTLLNELQYNMRFVNRDSSVAVSLFEKIATQLNGASVRIVSEDKPNS